MSFQFALTHAPHSPAFIILLYYFTLRWTLPPPDCLDLSLPTTAHTLRLLRRLYDWWTPTHYTTTVLLHLYLRHTSHYTHTTSDYYTVAVIPVYTVHTRTLDTGLTTHTHTLPYTYRVVRFCMGRYLSTVLHCHQLTRVTHYTTTHTHFGESTPFGTDPCIVARHASTFEGMDRTIDLRYTTCVTPTCWLGTDRVTTLNGHTSYPTLTDYFPDTPQSQHTTTWHHTSLLLAPVKTRPYLTPHLLTGMVRSFPHTF